MSVVVRCDCTINNSWRYTGTKGCGRLMFKKMVWPSKLKHIKIKLKYPKIAKNLKLNPPFLPVKGGGRGGRGV